MDAVTFEQEATRHKRLLYHVAYTILRDNQDCADAVQEAMLKAWQHQHRLRDISLFRSWLVRILINTCNSMLKKRARMKLVPLDNALTDSEKTDMLPLKEALDQLSPDLRLTIVLHYIGGFSVREISQMTKAPEGTVKTRLMYARQKLQTMLAEKGDAQ